jgi:CRP/FNR family cyclic AMP-dependent transcriptional regulator
MLDTRVDRFEETARPMDRKVELLRSVPLFASQGERGIDEISRLVKVQDVPAGRQITTEGEPGREFFVIASGSVSIERQGRHLRTLHAGDFLGEIALIDGGPRTATATTESDTQLLVIVQSDFGVLLERFPEIQATVLRTLTERIRRLDPAAGQ